MIIGKNNELEGANGFGDLLRYRSQNNKEYDYLRIELLKEMEYLKSIYMRINKLD